MAEYDNAGNLLRSYIHGPGIDEPIRMTDHSTSADYYYLADGLGSITQIQDSSKNTVESYTYDSFGSPTIKDSTGTTITQSAIGNPYMFTSREWDSETGLCYYRARYYDAKTGRFLSEDPFYETIIKYLLIYNPQVIEKYAYSKNNPILYKDPFGKWCNPISDWIPVQSIQAPEIMSQTEYKYWLFLGSHAEGFHACRCFWEKALKIMYYYKYYHYFERLLLCCENGKAFTKKEEKKTPDYYSEEEIRGTGEVKVTTGLQTGSGCACSPPS